MKGPYAFHPMTAGDMPLVRSWLVQPHVAEWWRDSSDFEYISADLAHPDMAQFIISFEETPFAYLQCYHLSDWDAGYGPQPLQARGLDQIIDPSAFLGFGHGPRFIRQFCDQLFAMAVPKVLVDPNPANKRAIQAYEKAGFRQVQEIRTPDGSALMMERTQ